MRALEQYLPTIRPLPPQPHLGDYPALPAGYHRSAMRIYHALVDLGGGPVMSVVLADHLGQHRGNVDRHLTRLRSDGYVRRTTRGHIIVLEHEKNAHLSDDHGPDVG